MAERTWFRMYAGARENGKILELGDREFKLWVFALCIYCERQVMPPLKELAYKLRLSPDRATQFMNRLVEVGLMERIGETWVPHDWDALQFESDSSADRVRRYRDRRKSVTAPVTRNGDVTLHVTPSETETETETETEDPPPSPQQPLRQPVEMGSRCIDDGFAGFRRIAEQAGMQCGEPEWREAQQFEWRRLDPFQQQEAVRGIALRLQAGATDDPVLKALPKNYLGKHMWARPIRAPTSSSGDKAAATRQALARVFAEEAGTHGG